MPHKVAALSNQMFGYDASMKILNVMGCRMMRQGGRRAMFRHVFGELLTQIRPMISGRMLCVLGVGLLSQFSTVLAHAEEPSSYTLVIHLTPAMCATHPELRRLRQCQEGFSLTVSRLQAEPPQSSEHCAQEPARLPPLQSRIVERIMPDEQLRNEAWRTSGSCTGMSATVYFRTITRYADRLKVPPEFNMDQAVIMRKDQLLAHLTELNTGLHSNGLQLNCSSNPKFRQPVLTEIRVCYSPNGAYIECPASVQSNCPARFVVQGSPY
ncbi:MAG: ribonuclease I [Pseudomonadota bacterium]|nr:ribonuclease I [Pseudomonadota bacterium]